jgi:hypothetical protein
MKVVEKPFDTAQGKLEKISASHPSKDVYEIVSKSLNT